MSIGDKFKCNSTVRSNPIGRYQRCTFYVGPNAKLTIGNHVGISASSVACHHAITIEDHVKIGGNVVIYDTDFHSLNSTYRQKGGKEDQLHTIRKPVIIKRNAFIGAHSTILKGVVIGENSIIGACSVVSNSIPDNEIWAGNPARFIKTIGNAE